MLDTRRESWLRADNNSGKNESRQEPIHDEISQETYSLNQIMLLFLVLGNFWDENHTAISRCEF